MNSIKKYRLAHNMTQDDLANMLNIDRSTVAKWETGAAAPRVDMLKQLASILKCTCDDLLCKA